jgi:4-methylaminobutanoate oxidase (formaldehyde-forming)
MNKLTGADLSNEAYPFGTAKEIEFGWTKALALRISYVGELGWEIYIPSDYARVRWTCLLEEGKAFGLKPPACTP